MMVYDEWVNYGEDYRWRIVMRLISCMVKVDSFLCSVEVFVGCRM